MLNVSELNSSMLNAQLATFNPLVAGIDDLEFDGYSLQNDSIISTDIHDSSAPNRDVGTFKIPRGDGSGYLSDYYHERHVRVSGWIKASTAAGLETLIDTMKRRLTLREGNLDRNILQSGNIRRTKATLVNTESMFARREGYHITTCPFDLDFLCLDPMWERTLYDANSNYDVTNLNFSESIENLGTYKAKAVIVLIIDAVSAVTQLQFENTTNGQIITIARSFSAADIVVIDGEQKSVTVNGVEVDYTGVFPDLEYGTNTYTVTTTGTSITYTLTVKFKKNYL